ncbi:MAG TPA: zinc ribbon domain-containing protein [Kutzneria sp.]|nr:zinc ribbon domain-containing protein [Kutzneria sp.]
MTPCPTCGRELTPHARFCGSCGTPVAQQPPPQQEHPEQEHIQQQLPEPPTIPQPTAYPPPPVQPRHSAPRSLLMPIVAGVAVLALATTGVVVFLLPRTASQAQPSAISSSAPTTTTTVSTTVTTTTEPTTTTPTPLTRADLQKQAATDHDTVETLVGQWVPQISSKKLGLVVKGVQFGYPEIMADFQSLKSRFPQAVLLNSDDYTNFSGKDFWVTVQATTFGTADEANAWCDQQGFATDDCYASRLMHTGGPAGNSKTR